MVQRWVFGSVFLFITTLHAQLDYQFQRYDVADGLSQNSVKMTFQDSRGFLWIGTSKGLNKFNGQTFEVFRKPEDSTETGILSNVVLELIEDPEGFLWMGTQNGLSRYDPKTETFIHFTNFGTCNTCILDPNVKALALAGDYIYLGTNKGLSRIHRKTFDIKAWPAESETFNAPKKYAIRQVIKLEDNRILFTSQNGIGIFNPTTENFQHINTQNGLKENILQSVFRDEKGRYWIGYENQGFSLLTGTWEQPLFKHYFPDSPHAQSHGFVYGMVDGPEGNLWLATFSGLAIFNPETESFQYLHHNTEDDFSISSNQIFHIYKDREERIWLSTHTGLNRYDPYLNQFRFLTSEKGNPKSLAANDTFSIYEDSQGYLWFGNYTNGLTILSPDGEFYPISAGAKKDQLSGAQVLSLTEDAKGNIWAATFNGINIVEWPNRETFEYRIRELNFNRLPNNNRLRQYTYFSKKGKEGAMWIGTHGAGLLKVQKDGSVIQYSNIDAPHSVNANVVLCMSEEENGRLWLGNSMGGLFILNPETDTHFKKIEIPVIFEGNSIHEIEFIDDQQMLISTEEGLYLFKNKNELLQDAKPSFVHFTEKDGLSDNMVYAIERTHPNTFWVSTGRGLSVLDLEKGTIKPFIQTVGRDFFDFNQGASYFSKERTLYFGSPNGVVFFQPDGLLNNQHAPKVYFDDLRILNEEVAITSLDLESKKTTTPVAISYLEELTLKPKDKIVSLRLNAVNHTLPKETQYAYMLEGFNETWTHTKNPIITRTNLDPGKYTLKAKAQNNDGVWSKTASLAITVLPPWYRTWWAYLLFIVLIIASVYALLKLRLQQERRLELVRAQEREIFRKRSSRDFHDEAGTKITRITLIAELARMENTHNPQLQEHLKQITDNIHELNMGMRDFIWTLDPTKDNAYDTLTRFAEFAGTFCEYANVQFKCEEISEDLQKKELNMSERRHLLLILKETLNNSIKHGNPSEIIFSIFSKPGILKLVLRDNGKGFELNREHHGNGLKNMNERAEALGGFLKLDTKMGEGTTLSLTLQTTRLGN